MRTGLKRTIRRMERRDGRIKFQRGGVGYVSGRKRYEGTMQVRGEAARYCALARSSASCQHVLLRHSREAYARRPRGFMHNRLPARRVK